MWVFLLSSSSTVLLLFMLSSHGSHAFAPSQQLLGQPRTATTAVLFASSSSAEEESAVVSSVSSSSSPKAFWSKAMTAAAVSFAVWTAPTFEWTTTTSSSWQHPATVTLSSASAKEMASGSGSRVNKDPESLLRYGLPIENKDVRKLQATIEEIRLNIGTKRKSAALDGVKKAKTVLNAPKETAKLTASCRDANLCEQYITTMRDALDPPLTIALQQSKDAFNGSDQERKAIDAAYRAQTTVINALGLLEEQMVPAGYVTTVPAEYKDLVQLQGRATVQMTLRKATPGDTFDVQGTTFSQADLTMVLDGYAAPVTAGNFVDLVQKGFYTKMSIQRSDGFVVQTGQPEGDTEADGYVGTGGKAVGNGKHGERLIPLEIFVKGDKGPFYETTIEDEGRGGQATVLPFSSYGAMGWAREEYDPNSGSSQFFWLLFDSDLTPAGKNVLDGRYPCFGYVVEGADFLSDVKEGDVIMSAKVTSGLNNLVAPK